jgi:hypothetical protein
MRGWQGRSSDVLVHVLCQMEDASHHFVRGEEGELLVVLARREV